MMITFSNLKSKFFKDLKRAKDLTKKISIDHHPPSSLPIALQRFIALSGIPTQPIISVNIEWKNARLRFSEKSTWKAISCTQCNFLSEPIRLVYMKAKIFGLFSLEALDRFQDGVGQMLIKAFKFITLSNSKGYEMDKAALVTILAETMIIPSYALQSYIHWEEISSKTIKATISFQQIKASGYFHFNENFEMIKFETNDRYYTDRKGIYHQMQWIAEASNYVVKDGFRLPTSFKAKWNTYEGEFEYFKGDIKSITINT